jgi:hypothetical protein
VANRLHPKIEKKLWQNLKAQPIPYLTKAPTATIEEIFNYTCATHESTRR